MERKNYFSKSIVIILSFVLLLPALMLLLYSLFDDFTTIIPRGFTLSYYVSVLMNKRIVAALLRTIVLSFIPTTIMLVVLLLGLYAMEMKFKAYEKYLNVLVTIPYAIQGVILAVSLLGIYIGGNSILSNRFVLLVSAYCIVIMPYMYQGIKNTMNTINMKVLLEAAEVLGASKFYAYITIIIPSMKNGIVVSFLLSMGMVFSDYVLVNILAGSHYETISIYLRKLMAQSGQASSVILVLMFMVMVTLSSVVLGGTKKKSEE